VKTIVNPLIEQYMETLRTVADDNLGAMERRAAAEDFPIVGPEVGMLLYLLAKIGGARRVLELGSGYGYSAYWFALALPAGGQVIATDLDPIKKQYAERVFARAGMSDKLHFVLGNGLEVIDSLDGPFDIIFNDVDKEDYPDVIEKAAAKLRPGGLFITDNTLWYAKVVEDPPPDETTVAVQCFNRSLAAHPQFEAQILPLRDGLTVAVRK